MEGAPKFQRNFVGNRIGWEIYSIHCFFLWFSPGLFEIQINKWPIH